MGLIIYLTILLHIYAARNGGSVLIDEIENGFHYSIIPQVWQFIGNLAKDLNVQVLLLHIVMNVSEPHIKYIKKKIIIALDIYRLDSIDNEIKVIKYDKKTLETSFDLGWEIR